MSIIVRSALAVLINAPSFLTPSTDLDKEKITFDTPGPHSYPDMQIVASLISTIKKKIKLNKKNECNFFFYELNTISQISQKLATLFYSPY